jgi:hypothetical protein
MTRWISGLLVAFSLIASAPAFAQMGPAGAGRAEITIIPGGAIFFTENKESSAPSFGSYQLGASVTYNANRFIGIEGEVGSALGTSQSLDFGYSNSVRTPDTLNYSGNLVVSLPNHSAVVPYASGGVGGFTMFARDELGINDSETRFTTNIGGGVKWYGGRWGLRGDYRFIVAPSNDKTSAFFGTETRYGHRVYGALLLNVGR